MPQVAVAAEPTMVKPIIQVALAAEPGQVAVVQVIVADMVAQVEPTVVAVVDQATTLVAQVFLHRVSWS